MGLMESPMDEQARREYERLWRRNMSRSKYPPKPVWMKRRDFFGRQHAYRGRLEARRKEWDNMTLVQKFQHAFFE